jgi:hypothetical protein
MSKWASEDIVAGVKSNVGKKVADAVNEVIRKGPDISSGDVRGALAKSMLSGDMFKRAIGGLFYLSVAALVLFFFLVFLHYTTKPIFAFNVGGDGLIEVPTTDQRQVQYENSNTLPTVPIEFTNLVPYPYTIFFNCTLQGDFTTQSTPLVLLYRSAKGASDIYNFPDSNIVVFIDPFKNDLTLAFSCENDVQVYSKPIENIPIRKPFRIGILVTCQYVEVYINGELNETTVLPKKLMEGPSGAKFYGPPQSATNIVKVSNIVYYPEALSPKMIRILGKSP